MYPEFDISLTNQLTTFLGPLHRGVEARELCDQIDWQRLVRYGRFRVSNDGARIRTAKAVQSSTPARDNSFVRFDLLPDANAAFRRRPDRPVRMTYYGQLVDIYYLEYIKDFETNEREKYLLARIRTCMGTRGRDASLPENPIVKYSQLSTPDIHNIMTIDAVVGRIKINRNEWAIIDRSRNGMRAEFVDEDGEVLD
ncbi:hypothetical protein FS749_015494 [Ceratobasidium sp. UAMH 11750]|nr:hypothetical protein FS749_015494 [Ceratobasidium sp. UAMH 11750]